MATATATTKLIPTQLMDQCAKDRKSRYCIFLSLLFFTSCSTSCPGWVFERNASCSPCFQSSRLYLKPEYCLSEIGVEIVQNCEGLNIYVDIYCLKIPPYEGDESVAEITLIVDETKTQWIVSRFEGGQRLLLSPQAAEALLNALFDEACVTIAVGCYKTKLTLHHFESGYKLLLL